MSIQPSVRSHDETQGDDMKLPIQAPPVARNSNAARPGLSSAASVSALSTETTGTGSAAAGEPAATGGAITPQADCVCRDTGGGQYRLFCRIGRNYYNTGRPCKP